MASPYSEAEKGQGQQRPSPRPGAPTPTSARPRSNVSGSSRARPGSVVSWMRSSEPRSPNDQRRPPLPKLNTSAKPARQATVDSQVAQPPKTPHTAHTHRQGAYPRVVFLVGFVVDSWIQKAMPP
ncbi:hypothetical protein BC834DRAFT_144954 [Gloeopeniophorella convolvens]|nr:hypothetical protein BC834DRAFT_144954 [Gloeopeniophorella convolvens]